MTMMMKHQPPFRLNPAALIIIPISAIKASNAIDQIDAIWHAADHPSTPVWRAQALAKLASKLYTKLKA